MNESAPKYSSQSGFTILEVLVAVTVLAMMTTIVFSVFFYTITNAEQLEERAALRHRAGFILGDISRTVSSAYAPYAGMDIGEGDGRPAFLGASAPFEEGRAGSLGVFTTNPRLAAGTPGGDIAYVSYQLTESADVEDAPGWVAEEDNPLVLLCAVEPLLAIDDGEDGRFTTWALNVHSLNLEYFDGDEWLTEWDSESQEGYPSAVKIDLELRDSNDESLMYSTVAYVHANTPLDEPSDERLDEEEEEAEDEEGEEGGETGEGEHPPPSEPGVEPGGDIFSEEPGAVPNEPGAFPFL
jgi:prepilin-type N-terminal cleavage/methylation domain-containing protein